MRIMASGLVLVLITLISGCGGEPEWVEAYEKCKESVATQSEDIRKSAAEAQDAQSRAMAESMGNTAISMAKTACEMIRTSCEEDADSPTCRAYTEQGRQE